MSGGVLASAPARAWLANLALTIAFGASTSSKAFAKNIVTMSPPIMLRMRSASP